MATIRSQLSLGDGMTPVLKKITQTMDTLLTAFEQLQAGMSENLDPSVMENMRTALEQARGSVSALEKDLEGSGKQQEKLNRSFQQGGDFAGDLLTKVKGIAAAYLGRQGFDWVKESLDLFDTQNRAEVQLSVSLANLGAAEGSLERLKTKAAELQGVTVFGDEALIGGAAEFATYLSDDEAIAKMMESLADYAAGMSGGGEVGYSEMVDYATQLGKVLNGSFDGIAKKGFIVTDAQKEIIENGSDMEKALVVDEIIRESWGSLAKTMAKTPTGRIAQMKNAWGDLREEIGGRVYPAVMELFDAIELDSGQTEDIIESITAVIRICCKAITEILRAARAVYDFFKSHWTQIEPILLTIIGLFALYKAAVFAVSAAHALLNSKILLAVAIVGILVTLFYQFTEQIVGAIYWLGALFTNVGLWIANVAIAIWNSIKNVGDWFANLGLSIWAVIKNVGLWFANLGLSVWAVIKNTGLWFANLGLGIWEVLKTCCSNVGTAFSNAWISVQIGFWTAVNAIMQGLKQIAEKANEYLGWMGVDIDTSGFDAAAKKIDELSAKKGNYGSISDAWNKGFHTYEYDDVGDAFHTFSYDSVKDAWNTNEVNWSEDWNKGMSTFSVFEDGWSDKAYAEGAAAGAELHDWMSENLRVSKILELLGLNEDVLSTGTGAEGTDLLRQIADATDDMADSLRTTDEDLAYLRDIAEREAVNRFTTAEVKIDMTGMTNRIDSDMDLDGVLSAFTDGFAEALAVAAEGAHK